MRLTRRFNVFTTVSWFALTTMLSGSLQAQTLTVLHSFTGGGDGALPQAGLVMDEAGNLYGTAQEGGVAGGCGGLGCGTVFKVVHRGSGWTVSPLYSFTGRSDGAYPGAIIIGPNGTLYGTTFAGGDAYGTNGAGVVFNLHPAAHTMGSIFSPWTETVLHTFAGGGDGANPSGLLLFNRSGNIYGTAGCTTGTCRGTVYELLSSGASWTENILYEFTVGNDGYYPQGGVVFDNAGNLYGTTVSGGMDLHGVVFQLTPSAGGWTETVLHDFLSGNDGQYPAAGLILDTSGNLYGTTGGGGSQNGGTVFELSPSNGGWSFSTLYSFYCSGSHCEGLPGPQASLFMDSTGSLLGTTTGDGAYGYGNVFKLTPHATGWTYTSLHDFTGGSDGAYPYSSVVEDSNGNLFGTTAEGGNNGNGVIWEITL